MAVEQADYQVRVSACREDGYALRSEVLLEFFDVPPVMLSCRHEVNRPIHHLAVGDRGFQCALGELQQLRLQEIARAKPGSARRNLVQAQLMLSPVLEVLLETDGSALRPQNLRFRLHAGREWKPMDGAVFPGIEEPQEMFGLAGILQGHDMARPQQFDLMGFQVSRNGAAHEPGGVNDD